MNTSESGKPTGKKNGQSSPLPWLRLWTNFLHNSKVQDVTRVTEALRARYLNLLCVAGETNADGRLPDISQMAFMMRFSLEDMQSTVDKLVEVALIDRRGKSYWIHDWDEWQFGKSTEAKKQKRYRDKRNALRNALRNDKVTGDDSVTDPLRNAEVTVPRARSDADSDSEIKKILPVGSTAFSDRPPRTHAPAHEANGQPRELKPDPEARGRVPPEILALQAEIDQKRRDAAKSKPEPDVTPRQS